jgi:hypothetical protein
LGLSCAGVRPLLPRTGHDSMALHQGVGSPCSRCIEYHRRRRIGPLLGYGGRPPITDLGNDDHPLLMAENGEVGEDHERRRLNHPNVGGDGRRRRRISDSPGRRRCRRRQQVKRARGRGRVSSLPQHDGRSSRGSAWEACPMATHAAWAPRWRAPWAEANQPAWRAAAPAAEAGFILRAFVGARPAGPYLRLLKRETASSRHTVEKPKQRYPQILTRSGARPIVPAGKPLGPRPPQALSRVAPLPASAPLPSQTPKAPRERPAQASSRRPRDQPPVQPARAPALGGRVDWPNPRESQQLSRPRGQVPPRPASAPRIGT